MIWGSDWPVCLLAATYDVWLRAAEDLMAGCTPEQKSAIFGGNAIAFYGLAPVAA